jgi:RNA 3'-terminal phosphate cyclase
LIFRRGGLLFKDIFEEKPFVPQRINNDFSSAKSITLFSQTISILLQNFLSDVALQTMFGMASSLY